MEAKRIEAEILLLRTQDTDNPIFHLEYEWERGVASEYNLTEKHCNAYYENHRMHMYIVTKFDKIEPKEWYYSRTLKQVVKNTGNTSIESSPDNRYQKIIATTDKSLKLKEYSKFNSCCKSKEECYCNLPRPSQAFIEKFCEKNGVWKIKVAFVESCKIICKRKQSDTLCAEHGCQLWEPKCNNRGEISIYPYKDFYSQNEVDALLTKLNDQINLTSNGMALGNRSLELWKSKHL